MWDDHEENHGSKDVYQSYFHIYQSINYKWVSAWDDKQGRATVNLPRLKTFRVNVVNCIKEENCVWSVLILRGMRLTVKSLI